MFEAREMLDRIVGGKPSDARMPDFSRPFGD